MQVVINGIALSDESLEIARADKRPSRFGVVQRTALLSRAHLLAIARHVELLDAVVGAACIVKAREGIVEPNPPWANALPITVFPYWQGFKVNDERFADDETSYDSVVVPHLSESVGDTLAAIKRQLPNATLRPTSRSICGTFTMSELHTLATIEHIRHIEPAPRFETSSRIASWIVGAAIAGAHDWTGEGELIVVSDTGFDRGSCVDVHPAFAERVVDIIRFSNSGTNDEDGHGTHVAGCALGNGQSPKMGRVVGVAPNAKLIAQKIVNANDEIILDDDFTTLLAEPYEKHARIHNMSFNDKVNVNGEYTATCRSIDDYIVRNRDQLVVVSAGDLGPQGFVSAPGTAKNVLTVGASEGYRPTFNLTYGLVSGASTTMQMDRIADDIDGIWSIGSQGPTRDMRFKPDVVAPGSCILSAVSRASDARGNDSSGTSLDALYLFDSGTSMSAGVVSGCAAVLRQWLREQRKHASPSAALMRALLINGATAMRGQYSPMELSGPPDNLQGFGRVNVEASMGIASRDLHYYEEAKPLFVGDRLDAPESVWSVDVEIPSRSALIATLTWTDPVGEALSSDLDLIVAACDGTRCNGNAVPGSPTSDATNNVEQVRWERIPAGKATIVVRAQSMWTLEGQTFALVWHVTPQH